MQDKDFIKIRYSGRIKESNQEFDKSDGVVIVLGGGFVIPGVEDALKGMELKEKKTVEIGPDKGFGARKPDLIKLVPLSEFKKHNTEPKPGMVVDADGKRGKVLSVSSGRVRVDFNHPLAGRVLVYDLEVLEKVEKKEDKAKALVSYFTKLPEGKFKIEIKDKHVDITLPPIIHPAFKSKIGIEIDKHLGIEKTRFIEVFTKGKPIE